MTSLIAAPYRNAGNDLVLAMIPPGTRAILDVGCGAGDNARRIRECNPQIRIVGITHSSDEAAIAAPHFDDVLVADLETLEEREITGEFEVLLFSHVLEHLRDPVRVVRRLLPLLVPGGHVVVAVPNVLEWRTRMQFLRGRFVYADQGILDRTHMRFFTYVTAPNELIAPIEGLRLLEQTGRGAVPLGPLRRLGAARALCAALDRAGVARWPNFCCRETAMLARWEVERA